MMDICRQAEGILQRAGYRTRLTKSDAGDALIFEDDTLIGFLQIFPSARALVTEWQAMEKVHLARHSLQLRSAPNKAWNVYCVFLTGDPQFDEVTVDIDRIEEDFTSTRKIACAGVTSPADLERMLLPLVPVQMVTAFSITDYESRLRARLGFLPASVVDAIMRGDEPSNITRLAIEGA